MAQTRSHLVTFRLSEREYETLRMVSIHRGCRSVSDFVRGSMNWIMSNCDRRLGDILFAPDGQTMSEQEYSPETMGALRELNSTIKALSQMVKASAAPAQTAGNEGSE